MNPYKDPEILAKAATYHARRPMSQSQLAREQTARPRAFTRSATIPPNLDPPSAPRNMLTSFAYFPISASVVAARRLKGKTYHEGWSFRNEMSIAWLKFTLGTPNFMHWRSFMGLAVMSAKVRTFKVRVTPTDLGYWVYRKSACKNAEQAYKQPGALVLLYFHGGGYVMGDPLMHLVPYQKMMLTMHKRYDRELVVFAAKYPLAPEAQYPTQLNIGVQAYEYLMSLGIDTSNIVLGGDSAGGNLCLALTQKLRDTEGLKQCGGLMLFSPWVELIREIPPYAFRADTRRDYLSPRCAKPFVEAFIGDRDHLLYDPLVSPVHASLQGFPRMFLCWGGVELFREQISAFYDKAIEAGVDVQVLLDKDMPHGYAMLSDFFPNESSMALKDAVKWLAKM